MPTVSSGASALSRCECLQDCWWTTVEFGPANGAIKPFYCVQPLSLIPYALFLHSQMYQSRLWLGEHIDVLLCPLLSFPCALLLLLRC